MNTPVPKQGTKISVTVRAREDNLPFEAAWQLVPLGSFAKAKGGFGFPPELQGKKKGQYPFFKVSDMNLPSNRKQMIDANNWVDDEDLVALKAKTFPPGALIFPKIGATILTNKKRLLSPSVIDNNVVAIVIESENRCEPEFLYYWFQTVDLAKLTNPGTVPSITSSRLHATIVPIPPLHEQRKITAILGLVQQAIAQQERLLALTAELKKTLLHQLFSHGLRNEPQKQTELGSIPHSWQLSRLDEFCILQRGFDITKKEQTRGGVPVVSSGGIASHHNVAKVKGPGVVVGRKGTLGKIHFVEVDYWPHDTTLWVRDFKGNDPQFTAYFFETLRFERYNSGASNPTLNRNTIHAELVAYPNLEDQREIGRILRSFDEKAELHRRKQATLSALLRTLLHELMTAQIRVKNLDLEMLQSED